VFLAVAERGAGFQKLVVLKVLLSHLADDPSILAMFEHEARVAARLKHPNVVEVYEVLDSGDQPVLVMEYLRGASLRELSHDEDASHPRLPLRHHVDVIRQMCLGLHYCHEVRDYDGTPLGFVHRDVSPHNVYVTFEGEVRLLDFGISKVQGLDGGTQTGMLKGKIRYMAPEQMLGDGLDRRADIYAIGVMLHEAITGRDMWSGLTEAAILHHTVNANIPELDATVAGCTPTLVAIAKKCLAFDPTDRYETCEAIATALDEAIAELPPAKIRLGPSVYERYKSRDEATNELVRQLVQQDSAPAANSGPIDWRESAWALGPVSTQMPGGHSRSRTLPRRDRRWALGIGSAIGIGAMCLVPFLWFDSPPPPQPIAAIGVSPKPKFTYEKPALTVRAPTISAAVASVTTVRVQLEANPLGARIHLDGQALPDNPTQIELPVEGMHILEATASGYFDGRVDFRVDEGTTSVRVDLKQRPTRSRHEPSDSVRPPPPRETTPVAPLPADPKQSDGCSGKFVVGSDGLIHERRGSARDGSCLMVKPAPP